VDRRIRGSRSVAALRLMTGRREKEAQERGGGLVVVEYRKRVGFRGFYTKYSVYGPSLLRSNG